MGSCMSSGRGSQKTHAKRPRPGQGDGKKSARAAAFHEESGDSRGGEDKAVPLFASSSDRQVNDKEKDAVGAAVKAKAKQTYSAPTLGSGRKDQYEGNEEGDEAQSAFHGDRTTPQSRAKDGTMATGSAPAAVATLIGGASAPVGGTERRPGGSRESLAAGGTSSLLASYTLSELSEASDGFNPGRKLGEGGFGSVYWGELELEDGVLGRAGRPSPVAIKILNEDGLQGHKEWLAEVTLLGTLRHPHLVRLLGWCAEGTSRLLVYEYMPNGSLDALLHPLPGSNATDVPPWGLRMEIALGVAKCLEYLHEGGERPIIYRDLKSANVLLDHDYRAKLADFGLAKDGPVGDKTHVTTQVVGTHGYADPDYIVTGHLTPKSDVYGFGVLMLELITGRHALNDEDEETDVSGMGYEGEEEDLAEWALPYLDDRRRIVEIVDKRIAGTVPQRGLVKAALLSRQCINDSPYERPQMSSIVKTLLSIQHPYTWPTQ